MNSVAPDSSVPPAPLPENPRVEVADSAVAVSFAPVVKKERGGGDRMVRVGKWSAKPSKAALDFVTTFLTRYFKTEQVWTRHEHGSFVVAVRECMENTELVEGFRFNRDMEHRFRFTENADGIVEVELSPL